MKNLNLTATILLIVALFSCNEKKQNNSGEDIDYIAICEKFDEYAFEQKALLDKIRAKYQGDKPFILRFNEEQMSWIKYQDTRLRSLYSQDWDRYYRKQYGTPTFNGCKCKELIRLSIIRNEELRTYLEGPAENQQECPIQGRK
ncbi:MAG: hypothetical protein RLO81_07285 [Fulvivirga sp.]|uniref:hypothetical protein n=1 Tax=Fulvivirga sp. TaxID=1931237 RepID=UPI0032EB0B99